MGRPLRVALRFGMPSVVSFHAFRKQSFTTALTATSQRGASALCLHASAESVLALTRTFRWLISAFHSGKLRTLKLGACVRLSIGRRGPSIVASAAPLWNNEYGMSDVVIEPATIEDLDDLSNLLGELFTQEEDFRPDKHKQLRGLRLIIEQPNRGRVFVLRRDRVIVAMINLLFTISTAEGGFVLLLEDLVVHDSYRDQKYGSMLLEYAISFAKQKNFLRITLLTDRPEIRSQNFFKRHGFVESHMLPMRLLLPLDPSAAEGGT
jgi:GNAT superfamily N-acetyltransferase